MGSRPGKLCDFQGPRIHSPWGKTGDRLRPLSYQDVYGKMDGIAWGREGCERLLPGSRKAQALSRVPGSPEGRVRGCPVTGDSEQRDKRIRVFTWATTTPLLRRTFSFRVRGGVCTIVGGTELFGDFSPVLWNGASKLPHFLKSRFLIYKIKIK